MALLPYARRVATQRTRPPRDGRPAAVTATSPPSVVDTGGRSTTSEVTDETDAFDGDGGRRRADGGHDMKVILRSDVDASASAATSSTSPTATAATTCCRAGWPSWRPTAPSTRRRRCAGPATCATPATARRPRPIATTLVPKIITITAKAGTEGRLFGSVTTADVVDAVAEQTGVDLERQQLDSDPIKTVGQHIGDGQAALRRVVPDHRRGRPGVSLRHWARPMAVGIRATRRPRSAVCRPTLMPTAVTLARVIVHRRPPVAHGIAWVVLWIPRGGRSG